jgi:hypothetical protein
MDGKYEPRVFSVGSEMVALWNDTLYHIGEEVKKETAGYTVANHSGVFLKNGTIYSASRKDHRALAGTHAVFWKGDKAGSVIFGGVPDTVPKYEGINYAAGSRLLKELEEADLDASVKCKVCGHVKSIPKNGLGYEEKMIEHVNREHIRSGKMVRKAADELYREN